MSNIGPTGKESGVGWSSDTVEREIIGLLQDMTVDWDNEFSGSIDGETRLVADLGFTSIDVVQLAVAIEELFEQQRLPFQVLLMTSDGRYVEDVSVAELTDFVTRQLNREA
jgi:acyl carrier protein